MAETITLGKALNHGLRRALEDDPKVVIMGEDVGKLGGVFRITDGLQKDFGEDRVIDTPLAESGIVGTAIGLAIRGYRPVCEIQFDGFVFPAFNQIVAQVAKMYYRSLGNVRLPIVIRNPATGAYAPTVAFSNRQLQLNFLFSYLPTPGTVVYFGYGAVAARPDDLGRPALNPVQDNFFLKLSYLWRRRG